MLSSNCDVVEQKNNARQHKVKKNLSHHFLGWDIGIFCWKTTKIMFPSTHIIRLLPPLVNISSFFTMQSQVSIMANASGLAAVPHRSGRQGSELQTASRDAGPCAPAS